MADLSQTPANVAIGNQNCPTRLVQFGEAVTQGQPLYQSASDSKWYRADADTEAAAKAGALALTPGSTDGYGLVALPSSTPGRSLVNLGATLTVGEIYVVSTNVGAIAPIGDLASGDYVTVLGVATTSALLDLQIVVSNTAKP